MIDVGSVRLSDELQSLIRGLHRPPIERRRDLQYCDLLRSLRIVTQRDLAAHSKPVLFRLNLQAQIVVGEAKRLAVERAGRRRTKKQQTQEGETELHFLLDAPCACRCRTISYKTTAAATETLSDGTLPSIGIETRKSHFRFTRSCSPLPSPPSTKAQSIL